MITNIPNWLKYTILGLTLSVILILTGIFVGRKTIKIPDPIVEVKVDTLPPIKGTVDPPYRVESSVIDIDTLDLFTYCIKNHLYDHLIPVMVDSVVVTQKVDTLSIISKYITRNKYTLNIFNNEFGKLTVYPTVQYNELRDFQYEFLPYRTTVTNTVVKKVSFEPYLGIGIGTLGSGSIQLGVFTSNGFGSAIQYRRGFAEKTNEFSLFFNYKF